MRSSVTMRRTVLFGTSLLVALVAQEVVLRVVVPEPELTGFFRLRYAPPAADPTTVRSLPRRALWWISEPDGATFVRHTNLYGFRDAEWSTKPGRESRVALLGDSFLEGLGAADGGTIVDHLRREAGARRLPLELMSFGAGGFGLQELWSLASDAIDLFHPDHVVLVFYANDFYQARPVERPPPPMPRPHLRATWRPRLAYVRQVHAMGDRVPTRWREPTGQPQPLHVAPRLQQDRSLAASIERFVAPQLAAAMRRGTLNPAITNHLIRSERLLPRGAEATALLLELDRLVATRRAGLYVAYLPSLNQVSDRYLDAQRMLSAPASSRSLMGEPFQQQARDLRDACRRAGIPFLDLTPHLRLREERGEALYWAFDGHMNAAGYAAVAEVMARRWIEGWAVMCRPTAGR